MGASGDNGHGVMWLFGRVVGNIVATLMVVVIAIFDDKNGAEAI